MFTAHSLPLRVIEAGDPYANEVAGTARGVAERCGLTRYRRAYQSAGRTPEPWIGLDLGDLIRDARRRRRPTIPGRADRVRLRSHGNPVRHRRPGAGRRARALARRCGAPNR